MDHVSPKRRARDQKSKRQESKEGGNHKGREVDQAGNQERDTNKDRTNKEQVHSRNRLGVDTRQVILDRVESRVVLNAHLTSAES